MKKTSKKLLSFFLAVVMIITSCSVGFTAFAKDSTTDSYWSSKSDAEAAFDSLNDLVDTYLPLLLQNDSIKGLLEDNLNMTVTEDTTISDIVEGASPLLLGLLAGSANKGEIRGDNSPLADMYFAYLEDENAAMDFYSLYKFCKDNAGKSGAVGEYADATLPKLEALVEAYKSAKDDFDINYEEGQALLEEYMGYVFDDSTVNDVYGGDLSTVPLSVLEAINVDGVPLKNVDVTDMQGYINYMNGMLSITTIDKIENCAQLVYYTQGMGQTKLFAEIYLGLAGLSGISLNYEGKSLTLNNYKGFASDLYSFDEYCQDEYGCDATDLMEDADAFSEAQTKYEEIQIPAIVLSLFMDGETEDSVRSPFYYELCVGVLNYAGLYNAQQVEALKITDDQIDEFVEYAKANFNKGEIGGQTNVDIDEFIKYINSDDCKFSAPAKEYIFKAVSSNAYKSQFVQFQRLATDGDKAGLKNYAIDFGDYSEGKSVFETVNYMIPSVLLNQKIGNDTTAFQAHNVLNSFIGINTYKENIATKVTSSYEYDDYTSFTDKEGNVITLGQLTVESVNETLNGLLDQYLTKPIELGPVSIDVPGIIASLVESNIELYKGNGSGALDDLWKNLHDAPIETIFKLLPVLDILLDEVVVPLIFNGDNNDDPMLDLYGILLGEGGILADMGQGATADNPAIGIGALNFDLNKALPAILHWLTAKTPEDKAKAAAIVGTYSKEADKDFYDNLVAHGEDCADFESIPKFLNIYVADKAIAGISISSLDGVLKKAGLEDNIVTGLIEVITELATFAMESIDEYLAAHANDARYGVDTTADIVVTQRGLNNIMVAIPQLLDTMGKKFINKYNINSDWTYCYDGKIVTVEKEFRNGKVTQLQNAALQNFKDSSKNGADAVLGSFVNILIGNWINAILDLVNDTIVDKDNVISKDLHVVNSLLNALGGFGETSILTDVINGFFGLNRKDAASFTLKENEATGFNGFSNESGFFLLTNIEYKDEAGISKGIVPFIQGIIAGGEKESNSSSAPAQESLTNLLVNSALEQSMGRAALNNSKKVSQTNYDLLLSKENVAGAEYLISKLDNVLLSLLKNTSLDKFTATSTDDVLSAVINIVANIIGPNNTEYALDLLDAYLDCIVGENTSGPVNKNKVYTSANLSNLVVKTYVFAENIVDYYLGNLLTFNNSEFVIDAIHGVISPDSVGVRMSKKFSSTKKEILSGHKRWAEFIDSTGKVEDLGFGFSAGNKDKFYDGLGESISSIAAILGFVLTGVAAENGENIYSAIVYPVLNNLTKTTKKGTALTPAEFNAASDAEKLINGIIAPLSASVGTLFTTPAAFIINLVQTVAGLIDDDQLNAIIDNVNGIANHAVIGSVDGVCDIVGQLSPTLKGVVKGLIDPLIASITRDVVVGKDDDGNDIKEKVAIFPIDLRELAGFGDKDIIVTLLNGILPEAVTKIIPAIPSVEWKKLANANSAGEALLLALDFALDVFLGTPFLKDLLAKADANIAGILEKISATEIVSLVATLLDVVSTPTEMYWTFSQYAGKLTNTFIYPSGVSPTDANDAVERLDGLVENIFPLLEMFGVKIGGDLSAIVNDNLFTNENLTKLATLIYGSLEPVIEKNKTVGDILSYLDLDISTKGIASLLMDASYGATFSSAAATLNKTAAWKDVKALNWGFKNGSAAAQTGFVNGLVAILRPLNIVFRALLANEALNPGDLAKVKDLVLGLIPSLDVAEKEITINKTKVGTFSIKDKILKLVINGDKQSVISINLENVINDAYNAIVGNDFYLGSNAYESAIVPILEAFMCDNVKTYKQYQADIAKAKDNVLIDVLNPIVGLLNKIIDKPFSTLTGVLPNVAYFINSNGLMQAISNLLASVTSEKGLVGILNKNGVDINGLINSIVGKELSKLITDAIGIDTKFNLDLAHLEKCNIQVILVPVINKLLQKLGIKIPNIDFETLASLGTLTKFQSAAKNADGNYTGRRVIANKGQVLIALLRYIAQTINQNATAIEKLLTGIDAIKKNDTIKNIIHLVFGQLKVASKDDLVRAILYFFEGHQRDSFFNYADFKFNKNNNFEWGELDQAFCETLPPMLDGLVNGLLEEKGGLLGLIENLIYKDEIISKLATGLYGAVEGVKVGDMGSLATLLAKTNIDFTTANVAALLTNKDYGKTYEANAKKIKAAGSWKKVKPESLSWGVTDRESFVNALCAVLRPVYGVLDVLINDGYLNIFNLVDVPGSDGYSSTIVPLLEAFSCYNVKTQYQYREDMNKEYDAILKDVLNPLLDKVEDLLLAPVETLASMLPNLSLFFANDGLLQVIDNLLTPVSALLGAIRPILDVNKLLQALNVDLGKILAKAGLRLNIKLDIYDLKGTLKPLIGAENVVGLLNTILGIIKIGGKPLGLVLPEIDWLQLAAHGDVITNGFSAAATHGSRIYVVADSAEQEAETLIAVLRFVIDTVNYKNNYQTIVDLVGGLIGGGDADSGITDMIGEVLGMLQGDSDEVIVSLVDLLQQIA